MSTIQVKLVCPDGHTEPIIKGYKLNDNWYWVCSKCGKLAVVKYL